MIWEHLDILKGFYYEVKLGNVGIMMKHFIPLFDYWELNLQQGMFKMVVESNSNGTMLPCFDVISLTCFVEGSEC